MPHDEPHLPLPDDMACRARQHPNGEGLPADPDTPDQLHARLATLAELRARRAALHTPDERGSR